jgi:hypothetical protein
MALFSKKQSQNAPRRRRDTSRVESARAGVSDLDDRYTFRRNRTLTGSLSSQVAASGEAKAQLKSPRVHAHDLTRQRRHIGSVLLIVLAGASVLYFLVSQLTASVHVKVAGFSTQPEAVYAETIQSYFAAQPVERLRFLMSGERLIDYLHVKVPEIASVRVEAGSGLGASQFTVTMRKPIAGWTINGKQQYVDETGTAFTRNYFALPAVQIIDNSGIHVEAGKAIASNRFLSFVGRAVGLAKAQGYTVNEVIIPAGTTRQIQLKLDTFSAPVKLSIDRGVGEQVEDMARAIKWLTDHGQSPQYVDVRVAGKAYYR